MIWLALGSYGVLLVTNLAVAIGHVEIADLRLIEVVLLVVAIGTWFGTKRSSSLPTLGVVASLEKLKPRVLLFTLAGMAAALAAATVFGWVLHVSDADLMRLYREQGQTWTLALLDCSLIAPLLEEVVFRGIVLGALFGPLRRSGALWASSLMFATLHLTPLTVVHHTLLGLVCGYARLETRGLLAPILIHASYNALVLWVSW